MRELKFRAWDGENMHYNIVPWRWDFVIDLGWHRCEKSSGDGILGSGGKSGEFLVPGIAFKELMQFIRLKDCKGKEIYEGDVIRILESLPEDDLAYPYYCETEEIIFKNGMFVSTGDIEFLHLINNTIEVIGNIYETPELLKAK